MQWIEGIYWASAIGGGILFLLRTILMFTGGGDGDLDAADDLTAEHPGGEFTFNLLSLQGLTSFFTMFGLVGLTLLRSGVHVILTMVGGAAAGLFTVFVISWIFSQVGRFQSEGTLDIRNAIGAKGSVYLRIPADGVGQVQLPVQGALRVLDAVSEDGADLPSGTGIQVTGVRDSSTVIVVKL